MTITPKRRKLNKNHHHHVTDKSNSLLLGQSGGEDVRAANVDIQPEGSGFYSIEVEVPIMYDAPSSQNVMMMLCNNIIEVKLKCKEKYISYDKGSKVTCELFSVNGMNIVIVVEDANGNPNIINIPYSESLIDDTIGELSKVIINDISVKGERNIVRFGTEKNSWDFKFNLKEILEKKIGTIYELIQKFNVPPKKIISKFLSFVEGSHFILKFKNVRVVTDNIPQGAIDVVFSVKNDTNVSRSLNTAYKASIVNMLNGPKLNLKITGIPSADTPISEQFSGDESIVSNFLKKCAITVNGGIIDIKLVQLIFIFFYIIIQDSVIKAKDSYQNVSFRDEQQNQILSKELFKKFYNNQAFFNFLSFVYMSISNISDPKELSFNNIFDNMRRIAPQYKDLAPDLVFKRTGDQPLLSKGSQQKDELENNDSSPIESLYDIPEGEGGGILTGGAPGDEDDNSDSLFKNISRIIPMQITDFKNSPQDMIVTITIPYVTPPFSKPNPKEERNANDDSGEDLGDESSETSSISSDDSNFSVSQKGDADFDIAKINKFLKSGYPKTQKFIEDSLTKGEIKVQVGDCVQFVDGNGKTIKAIICFFKSGKYTYNNVIRYEAASNMVDYYNSMKKSTVQAVINEKESEPLNLISLLNLRGFAYLPYEEVPKSSTTAPAPAPSDAPPAAVDAGAYSDYTILYDCKSEITRLHNGYNPSDKIKEGLKSIGKTLIPISTEFTVGSIGALQFNTASYITLKKIEYPPKKFEKIREFLQKLGMADERTITRSIQTFISQYGLSKLCEKMVSPDDVNRMYLFKQKVIKVDREFYDSGVFNMKVNQYNVYKSNIFIQGLLDEKISEEDMVALFQSKYNPPVSELIYWFFTDFARIDPTRAMVMVFQAFAHDNDRFKNVNIQPDKYPRIVQSGGVKKGVGVDAAAGEDDDEEGGDDDDEEGEDDEGEKDASSVLSSISSASSATPLVSASAPPSSLASASASASAPPAAPPAAPATGGSTDAKIISDYIKELIDIVRKNGLYDPKYLDILMSALKAAMSKYTSKIKNEQSLFSAETADPENAEAAMQDHIKNANDAAKEAADAAKEAREAAEQKSKDDDELRHKRQLELAAVSNGAMSRGKGAFDLSSLLKSRDGSNIDNQLGTCISGNNVVISCDGQTVRIDLDLATLLSTCADSFTLAGLNDVKPSVEASHSDGNDKNIREGDEGGDQTGEEQQQQQEEVKVEEDDDDAAAKKKLLGGTSLDSSLAPDKPSTAPPPPAAAAKLPIATSVKAEYDAYDTDYQKFKRDPVYKYLDYDAEVKKFMQEYEEFLSDTQRDLLEIPTEADKKKREEAPQDTVVDMTASK